MSPLKIYEKRTEDFRTTNERLQIKGSRLSLSRLIAFVSGILLFVSLSSVDVFVAGTALAVSLVIFVWLVIIYDQTEKKRIRSSHLEKINSLEMSCLEGEFSGYRDGSEYTDREHPYSYDLDIFGKASLFQYLNRTTSKPAADMLAYFLKNRASVEEILLRQDAIKELTPMIEWRQEQITLGYTIADAGSDPGLLLQWLKSKDIFPDPGRLIVLPVLLSAVAIAAVILVVTGLPAALLAPAFLLNFLFYFSQSKKITKLHQQVSKSSELLKAYSSIIGSIEKEDFTASKLKVLKSVFLSAIPASVVIKNLSKLVNQLDRRMNVLVSIPLNLLFFNDIHYCIALERWKRMHSAAIPSWFAAMAEFEVLSSLANMSFNNPDWVYPLVVPDFFEMKAVGMGHPLIPPRRRINNDIEIKDAGKTILITGSNMSGKSTFLRTCGVNTVLAFAGATVCAEFFTVSLSSLHSSMRISDSLEDNTSSFYAELKRLRSVIAEADNNPEMFILLDEILRGTNSNDRFTGSVALINQLAGYGTVTMVATHDLRLAEMPEGLKVKTDNYHFDVKINGEELYFDYRLTPGICTSLNASILMKKMGIKV